MVNRKALTYYMSFCCRVDIHRRDGLSTDTVSFLKLVEVKKMKEKGIEKWKLKNEKFIFSIVMLQIVAEYEHMIIEIREGRT